MFMLNIVCLYKSNFIACTDMARYVNMSKQRKKQTLLKKREKSQLRIQSTKMDYFEIFPGYIPHIKANRY